jgi:hypothetical protein
VKNLFLHFGLVIFGLSLSSCAPSDPFVGKWRAIFPSRASDDIEIEKSANGYAWRDAQGKFQGQGVSRVNYLTIARSLHVVDFELTSMKIVCTVTDNRANMSCNSDGPIEPDTYERK